MIGLNIDPVYRLDFLWKKLPKKSKSFFEEMNQMFSHTNNFERYRIAFEKAKTPKVKHILFSLTIRFHFSESHFKTLLMLRVTQNFIKTQT